MRGHRDRHRAQLRFFGEAQRGVDQPAVGRGDQDALALARPLDVGVGRQRDEVERGVVGRDRQVTLELEPHHVLRSAGDGRQLDRLHGDGRAHEPDRHRARAQRSRVELRAQRGAGIFRVDGERLHPIALDRRDAEPVTEHHDGEPERREFRDR